MKVLGLTAVLAALLVQNVSAISGGKMALPGQFPYQALIRPTDQDNSTFCSGALIDSTWILTAASCVNGKAESMHTVLLGAFDLSLSLIEEESRVEYIVSKKIVHDGYSEETRENDIALLQLDVAAPQNEFIAPIRLPSKKQVNKSFLLWNGHVSGWGYTKTDDKSEGNWVLRWFNSLVEPNFWCRFRNGSNMVRDNNICLSSIWKKGTCLGDAGNPVAITEWDDKATLVGIASNDNVSCANHRPPIFTRVTSYLDWISQAANIKLRN